MRNSTLAAFVAVALAVGVLAADWEAITRAPTLRFPADHGAHPGYRTEWWYVTGHLSDDRGEAAGFQLTFFRRGIDPAAPADGESRLRARHVLAGHFALADLRTRSFAVAERLRRADGLLAGFATDRLEVFLEGWELRAAPDGGLRLSACDREAGVSLALALSPRTPPVLHGEAGLSRKGAAPGNASAYVTMPRLAARGTLTRAGRVVEVTGEAWLDHEWGTSQLEPGVVGWDWFGLRLDDGRALMLYRLRRADSSATPFSSGTLVAPDGTPTRLGGSDFLIEATGSWTSPLSGGTYPSGWRVQVAGSGLDLRIEPQLRAAELHTPSTGTVYWEGPVAVSGTASGRGYAELTGYAGSLGGRF